MALGDDLEKIKPLDRAARFIDKLIPALDPADTARRMNARQAGITREQEVAQQLDAKLNMLPEPIKERLPQALQGGPAHAIWAFIADNINQMQAADPQSLVNESPRERAMRQYGEGIKARIERRNREKGK